MEAVATTGMVGTIRRIGTGESVATVGMVESIRRIGMDGTCNDWNGWNYSKDWNG